MQRGLCNDLTMAVSSGRVPVVQLAYVQWYGQLESMKSLVLHHSVMAKKLADSLLARFANRHVPSVGRDVISEASWTKLVGTSAARTSRELKVRSIDLVQMANARGVVQIGTSHLSQPLKLEFVRFANWPSTQLLSSQANYAGVDVNKTLKA